MLWFLKGKNKSYKHNDSSIVHSWLSLSLWEPLLILWCSGSGLVWMVGVISYSISDAQHQWPFVLGRPLGSEDTEKSLGLMMKWCNFTALYLSVKQKTKVTSESNLYWPYFYEVIRPTTRTLSLLFHDHRLPREGMECTPGKKHAKLRMNPFIYFLAFCFCQ